MRVSLIVIAESEFGIGKEGNLPWYFSAYQEYFEKLVAGHVVLLGRKTYEARGALLGTKNILLTKNRTYHTDESGVLIAHDLCEALERAKWMEIDIHPDYDNQDEIFIVGGAELFEHALVAGVVDRLYLTHISRRSYPCDTYFQDSYLHENFNEQHRTVRHADEANKERLEFVVYNRRRADQGKDKKKTQ